MTPRVGSAAPIMWSWPVGSRTRVRGLLMAVPSPCCFRASSTAAMAISIVSMSVTCCSSRNSVMLCNPLYQHLYSVNEVAQRRQIAHVSVIVLGRFQHHGQLGEAAVVEQQFKTLSADIPLTDVLVAVDTAAQIFFRIVQMDDAYALDADQVLPRVHHLIVALGRAEIVPGRQQMAGIKTKPQPLRFGHLIENGGEVFELGGQHSSLSSCHLQRDGGLHVGGLAMDTIDGGRDAPQPLFLALTHMRTWVNYEVGNAQQLTALQFIEKGLNGFFVQGLVRRRQVNEIGAVSDDRTDASRLAGVAEDGDFGGRQRLGLPLVGVLGENLYGIAADFLSAHDCFLDTTADRHMGA